MTSALGLDDPIGAVAGVGPQREQLFHAAGLLTVEDLLLRLPLRYEDRTRVHPIGSLYPGATVQVEGESGRYGLSPTAETSGGGGVSWFWLPLVGLLLLLLGVMMVAAVSRRRDDDEDAAASP